MLDVIRRNSQSWVVKAIFAAIILTFVFWGANSVTSDSVEVVAKVNGDTIYRNDLLQELRLEIQNIQFTNPGIGQLDDEQVNGLAVQLLGRMVSRTLLAQEAKKLGITASDAELSAVITAMPDFRDATGRFSQTIYRDRLNNLGVSVSKFEEMVSTDLLLDKLQSYITGSVKVDEAEARRIFNFELERRTVEYVAFPAADYLAQVTPEEAEIIAFYSENRDLYTEPARAQLEYLLFDMEALAAQSTINESDIEKYYEERKSAFIVPAAYQLRHILISLPLSLDTSDEAVIEARRKADSLLAEIRAGKDFAEAARQSSDDAATRETGGDLGWVTQGQLDPSLDFALAELKAGDVSEPIRTFSGFHLVQVVDMTAERQQDFDEVRGDILNQLKEDAAYANMGRIMADVEDKIITKASFEDIAADYNLAPQSTSLSEVPSIAAALGLPAETFAGIGQIPAGEMLPVPVDLGRGFLVIKVAQYNPSFVPELDAVRENIVAALKAQGAIRLASDAASETLQQVLDGGTPPAGKAKLSEPATRFLGVIELGYSQDMTAAIFTAPQGEWLSRVFLVGDNAVISRVAEVSVPAESEWNEVSAEYVAGLGNIRKSELFNVFVSQLQKDAKIDVKPERLVFARQ